MNDKLLDLKKEGWIQNVMRIYGFSRKEAEILVDKIKPNWESRVHGDKQS